MPNAFDLGPTLHQIKLALLSLIRIPFELWYTVPNYIKLIISIIILVISILIGILVWENKDKWRHRKF